MPLDILWAATYIVGNNWWSLVICHYCPDQKPNKFAYLLFTWCVRNQSIDALEDCIYTKLHFSVVNLSLSECLTMCRVGQFWRVQAPAKGCISKNRDN